MLVFSNNQTGLQILRHIMISNLLNAARRRSLAKHCASAEISAREVMRTHITERLVASKDARLADVRTPRALIDRMPLHAVINLIVARDSNYTEALNAISEASDPVATPTGLTSSYVTTLINNQLENYPAMEYTFNDCLAAICHGCRSKSDVHTRLTALSHKISDELYDGLATFVTMTNDDELNYNPEVTGPVLKIIGMIEGSPVATEPAPPEPAAPTIAVADSIKTAIDALLAPQGLKIDTLMKSANAALSLNKKCEKLAEQCDTQHSEINALKAQLASSAAILTSEIPKHKDIPAGEAKLVDASTIFKGPKGEVANELKFNVPAFTWDHAHPDVPPIDPNYKFRKAMLIPFLYGLVRNSPIWLHGHSGTGKTTFVEQVAARLNWPVCRLNLDSQMERSDFVGKTDLISDPSTGSTISTFTPGVLANTIEHPYIFLKDEADFGRSDIMYVVQRVLEGKGLLLTEDAGKRLYPHQFFRMIATANTKGQGDTFGAYPGARPQSAALLDRYRVWLEVPYLDMEDEQSLVVASAPGIKDTVVQKLILFAQEMRKAFLNKEILQPISPRGLIEAANMVAFYSNTMSETDAIKLALDTTIINKSEDDYRQKLIEISLRTIA